MPRGRARAREPAPARIPRLAGRPDAALRDRHRRRPFWHVASALTPPPTAPAEELPVNEERGREDEDDDRDPRVQAERADLVCRVDPEQLLPEAAERVDRDVEREKGWRPEAEEAVEDEQQDRRKGHVDELVEEGRVERLRRRVLERAVLRVDLEAPRQVRRLAEELLVPPVPEAADPVRDEQPRRRGVHQRPGVLAGPLRDVGADDRPEEDPAPDAETAFPDLEDALPLRVGHLRPARDHVVGAGADDPGGDAPDGDAEEEVPVAALRPGPLRPAQARDDDADGDREQQHQPVHVDVERADLEEAVRRRGNRRDHGPHSARRRRTWLGAGSARGGSLSRSLGGSLAREARRSGGG